jgi:hypothetical protein
MADATEEAIRRVRRLYESFEDVLPDLVLPEYLDTESAIQALKDALDKEEREAQERERAEQERRRREARTPGLGAFGMNEALMANIARMPGQAELQSRALRSAALEKEVADEREALRRLRVDVSDSIRNIKAFAEELAGNPESSALISMVLAGGFVMFILGVIYPLSFLPVPLQWDRVLSAGAFSSILFSLRGAVLTLAVVVFGSVLLILWITNARLRYPAGIVADLTTWSLEASYSPFLEVRARNAEKKAAARKISGG